MKKNTSAENCWEYMDCPDDKKSECPAYLTETGFECWKTAGDESDFDSKKCDKIEVGKHCTDCPWYKKKAINILVVDDEKMNLLVTKRMLSQNGYEIITTCTSGEEAVELIKNNDFNLEKVDLISVKVQEHSMLVFFPLIFLLIKSIVCCLSFTNILKENSFL